MSDIKIDFNQDVHSNEHARPSPVREPSLKTGKGKSKIFSASPRYQNQKMYSLL